MSDYLSLRRGRAVFSILLLATLLACPSRSDKTLAPSKEAGSVESGETPFVAVAGRVQPAVVSIAARSLLPQLPVIRFRNPLDRFFKRPVRPRVPEGEPNALGSGVIIDERGYVLTNYHVVRGRDRLLVTLSDRTAFKDGQVKIVGVDEKSDLAVLKLATKTRLPAAKLGDSDSIRVGDWAIAVGNAFGLQGTVTVGVISAVGRAGLNFPHAPSYQDFIQTDAAINPGNSGGPLVNIRGEVIGINVAIQSTVAGNVGVGFAIPVNSARRVSEQLIDKGKVTRSYLGLTVQEISPDLREALGLGSTAGVFVTEVTSGSPADKAGLKPEDVLVKYNGKAITSIEHFRTAVAELAPGTMITLTVSREGSESEVPVRVATMPDKLAAEAEPRSEADAWLGLTVRNLTAAERKAARVRGGVRVEAVEVGSPAESGPVLNGDIITAINSRKVADVKSFRSITARLGQSSRPVSLQIRRGQKNYLITITPN